MIYNTNKSWYKKSKSSIKINRNILLNDAIYEYYHYYYDDDFDYYDYCYSDYDYYDVEYIHPVYNFEKKLIGYADYYGNIICHMC